MSCNTSKPHVLLTGWEAPVQKIPLVSVLREHAILSLTEAIVTVDQCLRGSVVSVPVADLPAAEALVRRLVPLGFRAEVQLPAAAHAHR